MKKSTLFLAALAVAASAFAAGRNAIFAKDWGAPPSFAVVNPVVRSPLADVVSLSGEWDFLQDARRFRLSVGEGIWGSFPMDWSGARKIQVPGIWEVQGVGEPGPGVTWDCPWDCGDWDLKHVYVGPALYRKTVEIPERWDGKRVWLKVGGVRSTAQIWVNGQRAAQVDAYCGARKFDITPFVKPGKTAEIVAQVRNDVPSRVGLYGVNHHFGGFYRDVELEATPTVYVDDVWVRGDVNKKTAQIQVFVKEIDKNGNAAPKFDDELSPGERELLALRPVERPNAAELTTADSKRGAGSVEVEIKTLSGQVVGRAQAPGYSRYRAADGTWRPVVLDVKIENCELWTPETPVLYVADVVVKDATGKPLHGWSERFGVRELKVVGRQFYLNGKPYFFRGCGDHNYDQINLIEPADRERFKEHMSIYKEAGFNYARFHTHSPFPEYFEAADEKGLLLQPELPYYHDVPTEPFPFDPKRDLYELFRTNRRYVSFATYSFGNEGYLGAPLDREMAAWIKRYDPDRLTIHQDGGKNPDGVADFATGGKTGSIINPWPVGAHDDIERPFVAHEYLNLAIKMNPRYEPRFTGIRQSPVSVEKWTQTLNKLGLNVDWGAACVAASERLQGIYQKRGLEAARLDPACDGYHFWSLVDASIPQGDCVAAQGYLNPFWEPRPNGVAPRDFYRFNGPTALLLTTNLDAPILVAGTAFDAEFRISHYDAAPIPAGTLDWKLTAKDDAKTVVASGSVPFEEVAAGFAGLLATSKIELAADAVSKPVALEFSVSIRGTKFFNAWDYWIFPKREKPSLKGFAVSDLWFDAFSTLFDDVKRIPEPTGDDETAAQTDDGEIWIVAPDEPAFFDAVSAGRKVFAISPASETPNVSLGWWSIGTQIGTAFADSPAFGDFPNAPWMDELWFRLIRVGALDFRSKPFFGTFEPLAVGEGRDSYYLYLAQTCVGESKVLGSFAIDLTQADAPEALALLDALLGYVASADFDPKTEAPAANFTTFAVPDGVVWGYNRVVKTTKPDERHINASPYSDAAPMRVCRQDSLGNRLDWTTKPFDRANLDPNGSTTFAFVGALGYWSEAQTDGFELSVDGKAVVRFDLPTDENAAVGTTCDWKNAETDATLSFELLRVERPGPDFFGVFKLTVPNALLQAANADAKTATLSVRSLGEKSRRWFGLFEYRGVAVK